MIVYHLIQLIHWCFEDVVFKRSVSVYGRFEKQRHIGISYKLFLCHGSL
jgi:hypothetical protein